MDERSSGPVRLFYPAFGIVDALLGYALFYFLVGVATIVANQALVDVAPSLVPEPLGTWAAVVCWLMFVLVLAGQAAEQWRENPRRFASAVDRHRFLQRGRPTERRYLWWVVWVLVGGVLAFVTVQGFVESFVRVLRFFIDLSVAPVATPPFRFVDAVRLVVFFLGYGLLTRGLDHLVVGSFRALLADWYRVDA